MKRKRCTDRSVSCPWRLLSGDGGRTQVPVGGDGGGSPVKAGGGTPVSAGGMSWLEYTPLQKGPGTRDWGTPRPERTWNQRLGCWGVSPAAPPPPHPPVWTDTHLRMRSVITQTILILPANQMSQSSDIYELVLNEMIANVMMTLWYCDCKNQNQIDTSLLTCEIFYGKINSN